MILDDYNSNLYLNNKCIHLSEMEKKLILFFITNDNLKTPLNDISQKFNYKSSKLQNVIVRLNKKIYPYARVLAKQNFGYYLEIKLSKKYLLWKKQFFLIHKDEKLLLNLYKQKEILEKKIKTLEKNII